MRNIGYAGITSFDMASDTQIEHSKIAAGRYTFTSGQGWQATGSGLPTYWSSYCSGKKYNAGVSIGAFDFFSEASGHIPIHHPGTYVHVGGNFDVMAADYGKYMDPAQNLCSGDPIC